MSAAVEIDADTVRRVETIFAGIRMIEAETDERPTLRRVVWRLLQEAVQTQRAIVNPGPREVKSGMPEVYHTPAEIFATEVEMAADQISYPPRIKDTPTAQAIERYLEVMTWLRFIRSHNVPRARRTLVLLAAGAPQMRVADIMGFPNPDAVDGVRYRAISGIIDRLKRDLPRDVCE